MERVSELQCACLVIALTALRKRLLSGQEHLNEVKTPFSEAFRSLGGTTLRAL